MLTAPWAGTRQGIERHLLDHLIPAAYHAAIGGRPARNGRHADRSRRALVTLARHLRAQRTYDIAWWQMNELPPIPAAQAALVLVVGLATAFCLGLPVAVGITAAEHRTPPWLVGALVGLGVGAAAAFVRMLFMDRQSPRRVTLPGLIGMFLGIGLPAAAVATSIEGPLTGTATLVTSGAVAALAGGSSPTAGNARGASGPTALLAEDRAAGLLAALSVGTAVLLMTAFVYEGIGVPAVAEGAAIGFVAAAAGSWGQLCVTRLLLGALGRMPVHLVAFLREAHDRGILRQAGGVYQFRHNLLQDHLAADTADD